MHEQKHNDLGVKLGNEISTQYKLLYTSCATKWRTCSKSRNDWSHRSAGWRCTGFDRKPEWGYAYWQSFRPFEFLWESCWKNKELCRGGWMHNTGPPVYSDSAGTEKKWYAPTISSSAWVSKNKRMSAPRRRRWLGWGRRDRTCPACNQSPDCPTRRS